MASKDEWSKVLRNYEDIERGLVRMLEMVRRLPHHDDTLPDILRDRASFQNYAEGWFLINP